MLQLQSLLFVPRLLLLSWLPHTTSGYNFAALFHPEHEEYNFTELNPETLYGAPYGGFSRASSSRLAKLPLLLSFGFDDDDGVADEDDEPSSSSLTSVRENRPRNNNNIGSKGSNNYYLATDNLGRTFACSTYLETELTAVSMEDSIFDFPLEQEQNGVVTKEDEYGFRDVLKVVYKVGDGRYEVDHNTLNNILEKIKDECDTAKGVGKYQVYEYCYRTKMTEIRISEIYENENKHKLYESQMINLGEYRKHIVHLNDKNELWIEEFYEDGDECEVETCSQNEETGEKECVTTKKRRNTVVEMICGRGLDSVWLEKVEETGQCSYKATVHEALLCKKEHKLQYPPTNILLSNYNAQMINESKSVQRVLDAYLKRREYCFTKKSGWWTYEFCYGRFIRQYHLDYVRERKTGTVKSVMGAEHKLGYYKPALLKPEAERIHNFTLPGSTPGSVVTEVYYEEEYTNGDLCRDADGKVIPVDGYPNGLERSASIRFYCGPTMIVLNVDEDSVCHYVMEISMPELCHHKAFRLNKDVREHHVVKCLPV